MEFKYLEWDSVFFSLKIGRIDFENSAAIVLDDILDKACNNGFKLIYLFSDKEIPHLSRHTPQLYDIKRVYEMDLRNHQNSNEIIADYNGHADEILELAYQSGIYSRFRLDPNLPAHFFYSLYKEWTVKSVNKTIADYVPVVVGNDDHEAFGTLKIHSDKAVIGLFAVDQNHRRKSLGRKVMQSLINYSISRDIKHLEVATQKQNLEACFFYEKIGFNIQSETFIYHIWL
ncbi:GNAT family N-acetyltransferase [Chryseobacterium lacus]|uniref:GNAT family N-acetyltransferase n=1 Tax=Chryseobacterium lacus TaxID=2058346 RepID=UPI00140A8354|nr:GNAT family N-acetyltransferase [Chryseobacterium lacus]